jgi:NAD(P)-dependent dehydrogenase (short-subunit alcohol dehydrogenase family)|tara:strand:- start:147 stop:248 length:102 start_codon:yes stop_codon:yes gene_type:complete
MARPEEIADYIDCLISEKNSYMTGKTITVSSGE